MKSSNHLNGSRTATGESNERGNVSLNGIPKRSSFRSVKSTGRGDGDFRLADRPTTGSIVATILALLGCMMALCGLDMQHEQQQQLLRIQQQQQAN